MIDSESRESRIRIPRPGVRGLPRSDGMLRASGACFTKGGSLTPESPSIGILV